MMRPDIVLQTKNATQLMHSFTDNGRTDVESQVRLRDLEFFTIAYYEYGSFYNMYILLQLILPITYYEFVEIELLV